MLQQVVYRYVRQLSIFLVVGGEVKTKSSKSVDQWSILASAQAMTGSIGSRRAEDRDPRKHINDDQRRAKLKWHRNQPIVLL